MLGRRSRSPTRSWSQERNPSRGRRGSANKKSRSKSTTKSKSKTKSKSTTKSRPKSNGKSKTKSRTGSSRSVTTTRSSTLASRSPVKRVVVFTNGSKGHNGNHFVQGQGREVLIKRLNDMFGSQGWFFTASPVVDASYIVRPNNTFSEGGTKVAKSPLALPLTIDELLGRTLHAPYLITLWNIARNTPK